MGSNRLAGVAVGIALVGAGSGFAQPVIGFTETFDAGASNWTNTGRGPLNHFATGGVGDSGYVSWSAEASVIGDQGLTIFRGEESRGASGNAFTGNWLTAPVTTLSLDVRHDAAEPMRMFVRFAGIANFPGVFIFAPGTIPAGEWTSLSFDISASNPLFGAETNDPAQFPALFNAVFNDVSNLQVVFMKQQGSTLEGPITFGLDDVKIVPAPGAAAMLAAIAVGSIAHRRR